MSFQRVEGLKNVSYVLEKIFIFPTGINDRSRWRLVYMMSLHVPFTFMCTILFWLKALTSPDLEAVAEVFYVVLIQTSFTIKSINCMWYAPQIVEMLHKWQKDSIFALQNTAERQMWMRAQRSFHHVSLWLIVTGISTTLLDLLYVLFRSTATLPIPMWMPFDWRDPHYYWAAYFYEGIAISLTTIEQLALDLLYSYLLFHIALFYRIIGMRLQRLGAVGNESDDSVFEALKGIIKLHQIVMRYSSKTEHFVSNPIFGTVLFGSTILCFNVFHLKHLNVTEHFLQFSATFILVACVLVEIFMPSFYGSQVTTNSSALTDCVYSSNWTHLSLRTKRLIFIYMELLKKPVVIKTGRWLNIGLPVFMKTVKNAYSLFALLMKMDK